MLLLTIPAVESYDERTEKFIVIRKEQTLQLEHSLVSLSKWESKWCKAFLNNKKKTTEEILDYIKCMTITQNVDPEAYEYLTQDNFEEIRKYIEAPMTAVHFPKDKVSKSNNEIVTSDLIFYWMITLNIPFECKTWHLNRLLALIQVCNIKNSPPKKRSKNAIARDYSAINAARRKAFNTRG